MNKEAAKKRAIAKAKNIIHTFITILLLAVLVGIIAFGYSIIAPVCGLPSLANLPGFIMA